MPSVQGEYRLPSAAQDGYQVSAPVYSACRPVKTNEASDRDGSKGQSAGGSERQTVPEPPFGLSAVATVFSERAVEAASCRTTATAEKVAYLVIIPRWKKGVGSRQPWSHCDKGRNPKLIFFISRLV